MYEGLTPEDKPALEDAKALGSWIARDGDEDEDSELNVFEDEPRRSDMGDWWKQPDDKSWTTVHKIDNERLQFVQWSDPEPVNIDLALAQIAEMEAERKPDGCGWCNGVTRMSGTFWTDKDENCGGTFDFEFCPNCGRKINSPYTEGEI